MPGRKKVGKKLKKRMKGGGSGDLDNPITPDGELGKSNPLLPQAVAVPVVGDSKPITTYKNGGSSYVGYSDSIFLSVATGAGLVGVAWFGISRSLIPHKYSEALSYAILAVGVLFSLFLVLFKGVRDLKPTSGIIAIVKNILRLCKYMLVTSVPALLILVQLAVLIYIMYNNAEYIFSSENIPQMFNVFNIISIVMVLAQCWVWKDKVKSIMSDIVEPSNPMVLPGFILAALLSGISISQLYVILEYLKTDC
jgi:hypothetical protein